MNDYYYQVYYYLRDYIYPKLKEIISNQTSNSESLINKLEEIRLLIENDCQNIISILQRIVIIVSIFMFTYFTFQFLQKRWYTIK